jgi:hypothetical protein
VSIELLWPKQGWRRSFPSLNYTIMNALLNVKNQIKRRTNRRASQNLIFGLRSTIAIDDLFAARCPVDEGHGPNEDQTLMPTNYAGYKVRTEYQGLRIISLFTGGAMGRPDTQKVSVITVNGRLGMTHVSRQLFPTLLEDARQILLSHCD